MTCDNATPAALTPFPVPRRRTLPHRAWGIAAVAAVAIVTAGAFATVPGLLVTPLENEFGWERGQVSLATAVNMVLYGLTAPFAAAAMGRFGVRRVVPVALVLVGAGALLTSVMTAAWQLTLYWGLLIGIGTGSLTTTFAATVTAHWFVRRRGVVVGGLSAAGHLGQLLFLPLLATGVDRLGWRPPVVTLALVALAVAALAAWALRDHPADVGLAPLGGARPVPRPARAGGAAAHGVRVLGRAARTGTFWLLAGVFAICGASTNGIMWSHWVPAAHDHGVGATAAASMLSLIGIFSALGALASGWLTDRVDPRRLLVVYFGVRALTLLALPQALGAGAGPALVAFTVVYGLVDIATVPPVIALANDRFGADGPIVFGWVNAAHQLGAGLAAFLAAGARELLGGYDPVWLVLSAACLVAAVLAPVVEPAGAARADGR
ncbi:Major Facilitator Superfamily protein [Streptomyces zhaozhouensis]|uniref:Major Facilitator Superfamily protein n=1 Tax=Streptomyces zhaozhouensis TaxID=1300267 RepID=A0A286DP44_9ACTN|nr:MFS transporter [Streptomyces zhaozhouensis]SOD60467.1 Major Facilitator Superfamily protein [Streptomyces zhaozhouensis]